MNKEEETLLIKLLNKLTDEVKSIRKEMNILSKKVERLDEQKVEHNKNYVRINTKIQKVNALAMGIKDRLRSLETSITRIKQ